MFRLLSFSLLDFFVQHLLLKNQLTSHRKTAK